MLFLAPRRFREPALAVPEDPKTHTEDIHIYVETRADHSDRDIDARTKEIGRRENVQLPVRTNLLACSRYLDAGVQMLGVMSLSPEKFRSRSLSSGPATKRNLLVTAG